MKIIKELKKRGFEGKLSGNNYMIKCPFHADSNPSLGVAVKGKKRGLFNCLASSCGQRGSIFKLLAYIDSTSIDAQKRNFKESSEILKHIKKFLKKGSKKKKKEKIKTINHDYIERFPKVTGKKYRKYIKSRGLNEGVIKRFDLREGVGKWRDRIVIPYYNMRWRLISFSARHISTNDQKLKVRKLKDSDIKKVLFGYNYLRDMRRVVLVEGEFDVMKLQMMGIPAVGLGNATISKTQRRILIKYCQKVYICLDNDVPKSKLRELRDDLARFIKVKVIRLPKGKKYKDPAALTRKRICKVFKSYKLLGFNGYLM
jgi:DNA primase